MLNQNTQRRNRYGKHELFEEICAVSFAMDELRLYLDTHPKNAEALALFTEYMKKRHELVAKYTEEYGPIYSYYINTDNGWGWNNEPMPWDCEV